LPATLYRASFHDVGPDLLPHMLDMNFGNEWKNTQNCPMPYYIFYRKILSSHPKSAPRKPYRAVSAHRIPQMKDVAPTFDYPKPKTNVRYYQLNIGQSSLLCLR